MTSDMRAVIVPKSDQMNADDLLAGPVTIKIAGVSIRPGEDQPVSIHFDGDGGKPYKPCKSMARVMVQLWGADANEYTGRSMRLYCDPKVLWGGMAVGGIRISHMSHVKGPLTMALTVTKGSRKPFTVQPLEVLPEKNSTLTDWIADKLASMVSACGTVADLAKVQASKAYLAAMDRGTDDDRAAMKQIIDTALARLEAPSQGAGEVADDDRPGLEIVP